MRIAAGLLAQALPARTSSGARARGFKAQRRSAAATGSCVSSFAQEQRHNCEMLRGRRLPSAPSASPAYPTTSPKKHARAHDAGEPCRILLHGVSSRILSGKVRRRRAAAPAMADGKSCWLLASSCSLKKRFEAKQATPLQANLICDKVFDTMCFAALSPGLPGL